MVGTVTAFDDPAGLGTVTATDGSTWPFQCTQIADGTRTIAVGTTVAFRPLARFGTWEAGAVEKV